MPAAQLSLFDTTDVVLPPDSTVHRRKRRHLEPDAKPQADPLGESATLFDDGLEPATLTPEPPAGDPVREAIAASSPRTAPARAPEESVLLVKDTAPEADSDAAETESDAPEGVASRVRFDAAVWHLRSESGDFIHILTGEVREEDDFVFAAPPVEAAGAGTEEWDLSQDMPEEAEEHKASRPRVLARGRKNLSR